MVRLYYGKAYVHEHIIDKILKMTIASSPSGFSKTSFLFSPRSKSIDKTRTSTAKRVCSLSFVSAAAAASSTSEAFRRTGCGQVVQKGVRSCGSGDEKSKNKKRVFFLDVNPLCYEGSKPSLRAFGHWVFLFFSQVSFSDPVIAVVDGEQGNRRRRELLPSYKEHRRSPGSGRFTRVVHPGRPHESADDVLRRCNVPVVRVDGHEADDVVATLGEQAVQRGHRVVIASPDKDFKQLISEDVQMVMPLVELGRWSFYTLKHYHAQYNCDPKSDLSIRCIMGDEVDGVPGIQHLVPGFGRKTAMKLVRKHGSLENLLSAAAVRTVGRPYAQEALTKYADYLRRNYQVLALKRDVNVHIQEEWLVERDRSNDSEVLSTFSHR